MASKVMVRMREVVPMSLINALGNADDKFLLLTHWYFIW